VDCLPRLPASCNQFHPAQVTLRSWLAVLYLFSFGSALGFSAYIYILKHSTASRVATYAFVNPVVALFLGWSLGGESNYATNAHCQRHHSRCRTAGDPRAARNPMHRRKRSYLVLAKPEGL